MARRFFSISFLLICLLALAVTGQAQAGVEATVIAVQLNVHDLPGTNTTVIGQYTYDTVVTVLGREDISSTQGTWVFTTPIYGGTAGWVHSTYLQFPEGFNVNSLPVTGVDDLPTPGEVQPSVNPVAPEAAQEADPAVIYSSVDEMPGWTITTLNFRSGPATVDNVIVQLPPDTLTNLIGRTADGLWVLAQVDGQTGWLASDYVRVPGNFSILPVVDPNTVVQPAPVEEVVEDATPESTGEYPGIVYNVENRARDIYLTGQQMGNRRGVFSKVGDSITADYKFLSPVGLGGFHPYDYEFLTPVVEFYMQVQARTHNSFANKSLAAQNGWTTYDLLDPVKNLISACGNMSPLECEYKMSKPAVALIMIGSNDANWGVHPDTYEGQLRRILDITIDNGVIPVISTLPENKWAVVSIGEYNSVIHKLSQEYGIPLWDYSTVMYNLPNNGLSSDGLHPSFGSTETGIFSNDELKYGYNQRNLTALMVLDALWRRVMY